MRCDSKLSGRDKVGVRNVPASSQLSSKMTYDVITQTYQAEVKVPIWNGVFVDEHSGDASGNLVDYAGHWLYFQGGPHHDDQVTGLAVRLKQTVELLWQVLTKKRDVGLNNPMDNYCLLDRFPTGGTPWNMLMPDMLKDLVASESVATS